MSNMAVEDILDELGGYGIVSLRKGLFSSGASPHLRGKPESWKLEIRLPGYSRNAIQSYVVVDGSSIRDVAERAYQALENYVFSPEAIEDRDRYVSQINGQAHRYHAANESQRNGFDPIRHPGETIPPIVWGERRGGFIR